MPVGNAWKPVLYAIVAVAILAYAAFYLYSFPARGISAQSSVMTLSALENSISANTGVSSTGALNASYSGNVSISLQGSSIQVQPVRIPFNLSYEAYKGSSRLLLSLQGNFSILLAIFSNGTRYSCISGIAYNAYNGIVYICTPFNGTVASALLKITNESAFGPSIGAFSSLPLENLGQASYKGQACTAYTGEGAAQAQGTPITYGISTCVSNEYNMPLNFTFVTSEGAYGAQAYTTVALNSVGINNAVAPGALSTLPQNSVIRIAGVTNSAIGILPNSCAPAIGITCASPEYLSQGASQGAFIFAFSENLLGTIYNVQLGCGNATSPMAFYGVNASGIATSAGTPGTTLIQGAPPMQIVLRCSLPLGPGSSNTLAGYLWLNYTKGQASPSRANPWQTERIANITIRTAIAATYNVSA